MRCLNHLRYNSTPANPAPAMIISSGNLNTRKPRKLASDDDDDEVRWQYEYHADERGAHEAVANVANPHRQLRRERPRHHLSKREPLFVLLGGDPATTYKVALHITGECDGASETERTKFEEIADEFGEADLP